MTSELKKIMHSQESEKTVQVLMPNKRWEVSSTADRDCKGIFCKKRKKRGKLNGGNGVGSAGCRRVVGELWGGEMGGGQDSRNSLKNAPQRDSNFSHHAG